jgi:hypothetical protein
VSAVKARRVLLVIWLFGTVLLVGLVFAQTVANRYGPYDEKVWGWLLPCIMPTVGLMLAVVFAPTVSREVIDRFLFYLSSVLSVLYLGLVAATLLVQPASSLSPLDLLERSHLWLGPSQGLIDASVGALFLRSAPKAG